MKTGKRTRARATPAASPNATVPTILNTPALWTRAATDLGVSVAELERATIVGQVADILLAHPGIRGRVAFKGGAVMHLVDRSPRLSADLDGVLTTGGVLTATTLRAALTTPEARRVIVRVDKLIGQNPKSIDVHFVVCRPLSRTQEITIRIQIGWRFPPVLVPEVLAITLRNGASIRLPVLARRERAAEKVRAFTERGLPRDAFDLHYYGTKVLGTEDYRGLPRVVRIKLEQGDLADGTDLHQQFDDALELAERDWRTPRTMVLTTSQPGWTTVERVLRQRFKTLLPQTLRRP